ncbi:MAG: hypothetical protein U0R52_07500 [Solirubrobacterales bacterium]
MQATWMTHLVKSRGTRPVAERPAPTAKKRRRFRHKAEAVALIVMLTGVFATGEAHASSYYLNYGYAKKHSKTYADNVCASSSGCYRTAVPICRRQGPSRVDCMSYYGFTNGTVCRMVITNRANSQGRLVQGNKRAQCRYASQRPS